MLHTFTSKKQNLPVFYLCIRYIEVRMYLAICYPTYFCVAIILQPFSCLNSYSYSFLPLHVNYMRTNLPCTCTEITSRNAKISTLDPNNFFLAAYFYTKFEENSYIYVNNTLPEFAPFLSSLKKSNLLRIPSNSSLVLPQSV